MTMIVIINSGTTTIFSEKVRRNFDLADMIKQCSTINWQTDVSYGSCKTSKQEQDRIGSLGGIDESDHWSLFCCPLDPFI